MENNYYSLYSPGPAFMYEIKSWNFLSIAITRHIWNSATEVEPYSNNLCSMKAPSSIIISYWPLNETNQSSSSPAYTVSRKVKFPPESFPEIIEKTQWPLKLKASQILSEIFNYKTHTEFIEITEIIKPIFNENHHEKDWRQDPKLPSEMSVLPSWPQVGIHASPCCK